MSRTRILVHIVTCTLDRTPWIEGPVERLVRATLFRKARQLDSHIIRANGDPRHYHILALKHAAVSEAAFVGKLKAASSGAVNRSGLLRETFRWQSGYYADSVSPWELKRLIRYIERQKIHHGVGTLRPRYEPQSFDTSDVDDELQRLIDSARVA